jgi:hypothetical protein
MAEDLGLVLLFVRSGWVVEVMVIVMR